MKDKWTMEIDQRGLYNGERPPYEGDQKILQRKKSKKIHCNTRKNITSEIAYPFKNLLLGLKFNLKLYAYSFSDQLRTLINC